MRVEMCGHGDERRCQVNASCVVRLIGPERLLVGYDWRLPTEQHNKQAQHSKSTAQDREKV